MTFISIEPTKEGYQNMVRLFEESIERWEEKLEAIDKFQETEDPEDVEAFLARNSDLIDEAMNVLARDIRANIASLRASITEAKKGC